MMDVFGEDLTGLADFIGQPKDALRAISLFPLGEKPTAHAFYGLSVPRVAVRGTNKHRKICRLCLAEFGYAFGYWDLSFATVCPIHLTNLQMWCRWCGRWLQWYWHPWTVCQHCGKSLCAGPKALSAIRRRPIAPSALAEWIHPHLTTPPEIANRETTLIELMRDVGV